VVTLFPRAIDSLTRILLRVGLLRRIPPQRRHRQPNSVSKQEKSSATIDRLEACQEAKNVVFDAIA
jgi:hypothetical protein